MKVFVGIRELLTLKGAVAKDGRRVGEADLGVIKDAAIVELHGKILWVGSRKKLARILNNYKNRNFKVYDLNAESVTPTFIDCHTHLIFAGSRQSEFEMRNQGLSYQEITRQGGGIQSTVKATRACRSNQLLSLAEKRVLEFVKQGVTSIEIKSGYGLDEATEIRILKVAKRLKSVFPKVNFVTTYLGPHSVPVEKSGADYLDEIINSTLPKIKKLRLADRVDMFVEPGFFSLDHARAYFQMAKSLGFELTAHADQLTSTGAGAFLARLDAASVDHLVQINKKDIHSLAASQTTCVLLPASDFYLKIAYPPARKLLDAGARVALSTDFNPGTSPTTDINFVGVLARLEMKMSLAEVIVGFCTNAAKSLKLDKQVGALLPGYECSFVSHNLNWRDLFYRIGQNSVRNVYCKGIKSI